MRRLHDNKRAKCEGKQGGSILLSLSFERIFLVWIGVLKI